MAAASQLHLHSLSAALAARAAEPRQERQRSAWCSAGSTGSQVSQPITASKRHHCRTLNMCLR